MEDLTHCLVSVILRFLKFLLCCIAFANCGDCINNVFSRKYFR